LRHFAAFCALDCDGGGRCTSASARTRQPGNLEAQNLSTRLWPARDVRGPTQARRGVCGPMQGALCRVRRKGKRTQSTEGPLCGPHRGSASPAGPHPRPPAPASRGSAQRGKGAASNEPNRARHVREDGCEEGALDEAESSFFFEESLQDFVRRKSDCAKGHLEEYPRGISSRNTIGIFERGYRTRRSLKIHPASGSLHGVTKAPRPRQSATKFPR
jgi:hypothetical protein